MKRRHAILHASIAAFCIGLLLPLLGHRPEAGPPLSAAARTDEGVDDLKAVRIDDVPHVRQRPDFCGEACVAMALGRLGHTDVSQNEVFDVSGLDPAKGRGCYAPELYEALRSLGFEPGRRADAWQRIAAKTSEASLEKFFAALHADLRAGHPSIVCMRYDAQPETTEHFRLIVGYDPKADEVLYHEPAVANGAYRRMARAEFLNLWPLKYDADEWTVIRFRLKPGKLKLPEPPKQKVRTLIGEDGEQATVPLKTFTDADIAQHVRRLRRRYPMKGMTVVIERPFIVVGNEPAETVRKRAARTVRWATRHYKRDYFTYDPQRLITIWLLGDKDSYETLAKAISGRTPSTPFGFFLESKDALVMNIATGGGTLVHEMFHAFVPANFPAMPPWLNEGMASLYEQCGEQDGRMVGYTNWRLAGLKKAIKGEAVVPLKKLCSLDAAGFYGRGSGVHYAQARYLCYYLQQKGLLRRFYTAFATAQAEDPTGYETLLKVLDVDDADAFLRDWQGWVLKLKFPA